MLIFLSLWFPAPHFAGLSSSFAHFRVVFRGVPREKRSASRLGFGNLGYSPTQVAPCKEADLWNLLPPSSFCYSIFFPSSPRQLFRPSSRWLPVGCFRRVAVS